MRMPGRGSPAGTARACVRCLLIPSGCGLGPSGPGRGRHPVPCHPRRDGPIKLAGDTARRLLRSSQHRRMTDVHGASTLPGARPPYAPTSRAMAADRSGIPDGQRVSTRLVSRVLLRLIKEAARHAEHVWEHPAPAAPPRRHSSPRPVQLHLPSAPFPKRNRGGLLARRTRMRHQTGSLSPRPGVRPGRPIPVIADGEASGGMTATSAARLLELSLRSARRAKARRNHAPAGHKSAWAGPETIVSSVGGTCI